MFGIGMGEALVLAVLGIAVLGPRRLNQAARRAGSLWGRLSREWSRMERDFTPDDDGVQEKADGNRH